MIPSGHRRIYCEPVALVARRPVVASRLETCTIRMSGGHAIAPSGSALNESIVVLFRHSALVAAAAVTLFALAPNHCLSREWKATPEALAREYATINDSRPGGELILLLWFVPEMAPANTLARTS